MISNTILCIVINTFTDGEPMKAAQINDYGQASDIQIKDIDTPAAGVDQVLVEVGASSINPFDLTVLSGGAQSMAPLSFPATLGLDMSGTVAAIGQNVSGFAVGDKVYGTANAMFGASGAFAEFAATNADSIGIAPSNLSDSEAASLPTAGISGLQAINTLNVSEGQKVFIHGGAGGSGSIAIQVAKSRGAYVATTASTANIEFVKSLGADEVIDYKSQDFTTVLSGYDAVFTTVWSDDINVVLSILKHGGAAVSLIGPFDEAKANELGVSASAQMTHVNTQSLAELRELVEEGVVRPNVYKTVPLDSVAEAYETLANESVQGKIAITMR